MLSLAGFNNQQSFEIHQGGDVDTALLLAVSWLPTIFGLVAVALLAGYDGQQAPMQTMNDKEA